MTLQDIKDRIKLLRKEAYSLKTKAAKQKRWNAVRELERLALDILYSEAAKYGPQSIKVTVKRDYKAGEYADYFFVDSCFGVMRLSATGDVESKSWYAHTCCMDYDKGMELVLEIDTEVNHDTLSLNIIPKKHRGGRVNGAMYAELCQRDDLAFFKYPNSSGVTGLFKTEKAGA